MSVVEAPESSVVRLQGVGRHRTWVVVCMCALLIPVSASILVGIYGDYRSLASDLRQLGVVLCFFAVFTWIWVADLKTWLTSVKEVALVVDALRVSTRFRKFAIPLTDVEECKISIARVESRIEITLGVIPPGSKDFLKLYRTSKIDPVHDLQLLPALQRRGIRLIGAEEFKQDFERLTGKSVEGPFLP